MTIPPTLSARRAKLEAELRKYHDKADEFEAGARSQRYNAALIEARIEELDAANAAYDDTWLERELLAWVPAEPVSPPKRERRDLRGEMSKRIESAPVPLSTRALCNIFGLGPARAIPVLTALRDSGKITGDDNGWRLAEAAAEIKLAAE